MTGEQADEIIDKLTLMKQNVKWHKEKSYEHGAYDAYYAAIDIIEGVMGEQADKV